MTEGDQIALLGDKYVDEEIGKEPINDGTIDLDEAMEKEDGFKLIAGNKLRRVTDWRLMHKDSACSALTAGELRPNDYKLIFSMSAALIFWIILASCLLGIVSGETGAISSMPLLYIGVCLFVASSAVYQNRAFTMKELIVWIVVNVLYIALGISFFIYQYEVSEFTYDLTKRDVVQQLAAIFVTLFLLFMPTLSHALVVALRYADTGM